MANTISLTATVIVADGSEHIVRTNSYDLYRAEKALGRPLRLLNGTASVEELFAVIHSAAQRRGIAGDDLEAWLAEVDIAMDEEEPQSPLSPTDSVPSSSAPESPPTSF